MSRKPRIYNMNLFGRHIPHCGCGCEGGDPWHKKEYARVVRDVTDREGWALFPWGASRVTRDAPDDLWEIDIDDRNDVGEGLPSAHPGAAKYNDARARAATPERVAARKAKRAAASRARQRDRDAADIARVPTMYTKLCEISDSPRHDLANIPHLLRYVGNDPAKARLIVSKTMVAINAISAAQRRDR